ncbi:MAG: hypothetical protein F6K41_18135 [Symploca sp. SIO3E6]|nr:hypothetical protein [Caldora sp. SIO3E6]
MLGNLHVRLVGGKGIVISLTYPIRWQPNLFNFYYQVYSRLVNDLDIPFQLDKDAVRQGQTHVHEALREALVNTLIHADHQSTRPIRIVKFLDGFFFSNPGRLRIPRKRLYEGGISDTRNPNLQKMFQMLGLGEKAGSGFQKILRAWREQQWFKPLVSEELDLEMTSVTLPMVSLIPENVEKELREIVGDNSYCSLTELDRIILVLAHRFVEISNADIQCYRKEHPREIGECLKRLVNKGWLKQFGRGRGTYYTLPNQHQSDLLSLFPSSEHYESSSEHYESSSEHYELSSEHYKRLREIAAPVREKGRTDRNIVQNTILELCSEHYLQLRTLAELLGRKPDSIRNHYINPLLLQVSLELKYPDQPNHPDQAYRTVSLPNEKLD